MNVTSSTAKEARSSKAGFVTIYSKPHAKGSRGCIGLIGYILILNNLNLALNKKIQKKDDMRPYLKWKLIIQHSFNKT